MNQGDQEGGKSTSTRRKALQIGAATGAVAAASALGLKYGGGLVPQALKEEHNPDAPLTPELLADNPTTKYGFNTHLFAEAGLQDNLTLEQYKKDIDDMALNNQQMIRLNLWPWEAVDGGTPSSIGWKENALTIYDQAIDYAKEKGLEVFLVTNVPEEITHDYSFEDYLQTTKTFYEELAKRYAGKVDIWQIFNEPDLHNFRSYDKKPNLDKAYIADFAAVIAEANNAIKSVDPDAKVTVNINKWRDDGENLIEKGNKIIPAIVDSIDLITLDLYPFNDQAQIANLPKYVQYFKATYGKDIIIGELGMPTAGFGNFSEEDQARYIPQAIQALQSGPIKPAAILLYEITDWASGGNTSEQTYGIKDKNNQPKWAYTAIMDRMHGPDEKPTPPPSS